jgi:hypothetical protein
MPSLKLPMSRHRPEWAARGVAVCRREVPSEADIVAAFNDGARALALRNRAEHVQSIAHEFESLNMRRGVRRSSRRCVKPNGAAMHC